MKKGNSEASLQVTELHVTVGDRVFYTLNNLAVILLTLLILLPLINIVASSFSAPAAVAGGKVFLWPVSPSVEGYIKVFQYPGIWRSYGNTFFYTVAGTAINLAMTLAAAYPLARRGLPFKGLIMFLFTFTMMFSGGLIPNYMLLKGLGMTNTVWAMLLPGAISVYNMIVARTFIMGIPVDLWEAANIDGCSDAQYFLHCVLPLSGTLISVLTLFYAVGHWNAYFNAFIYLIDRDLYPLQILLREILIANSINADVLVDPETMAAMVGMADLLKFALIIVASVPILVLYPFLRKYFVKGVMIGSLKG